MLTLGVRGRMQPMLMLMLLLMRNAVGMVGARRDAG
jgi:hypothetical protein